jgi:PQQ-dependent catabolism-associated CXXCW motif protein
MNMFKHALLATCLGLQAQMVWPFAEEDRDWNVVPSRDIRQAPYSAPTPTAIPGANLIFTNALHEMLIFAPPPILIDVASGDGHLTLRGAYWLPGAGRGNHFLDPIQAQMAGYLNRLTNGDKTRPLVFFCVNAQCWLSYNASLRAASLGYQRVFWYRGGIEAWREADLPLATVSMPAIYSADSPGASQ